MNECTLLKVRGWNEMHWLLIKSLNYLFTFINFLFYFEAAVDTFSPDKLTW